MDQLDVLEILTKLRRQAEISRHPTHRQARTSNFDYKPSVKIQNIYTIAEPLKVLLANQRKLKARNKQSATGV